MAALASDAELLLLDEPTSGLDPLMEVVFQDHIREVSSEGRTVLLSSHILSQVEQLADLISIIRLGRVVQSGTLAEMRHQTRTTIEADTVEPVTGLADVPGIEAIAGGDGRLRFSVDGEHLARAVQVLSRAGVRSLTSHPPTLEELMLRHYGDDLTTAGNGDGEQR